ncbi:MAG: hypothetical protein M3R17_02775 [Bacteroidota bacterium]|nr:hypothetical protein [Bacteroidota bacterium]
MDFKLDRTAFRATNHKEKGNDLSYWKSKTNEERLAAAFYLNSVAYNFDINNPPRMDRTVFSMRKHRL